MEKLTELQEKILDALARRTFKERQDLADAVGRSVSSINQAIPDLKRLGAVFDGLAISAEWNPLSKFYIFIETNPLNGAGESYQWQLIRSIRARLDDDEEIAFEGIDIVIGADWDIVLAVRAADPQTVYRFVVTFLRTQPTISKTRTTSVLRPPASQSVTEGD